MLWLIATLRIPTARVTSSTSDTSSSCFFVSMSTDHARASHPGRVGDRVQRASDDVVGPDLDVVAVFTVSLVGVARHLDLVRDGLVDVTDDHLDPIAVVGRDDVDDEAI